MKFSKHPGTPEFDSSSSSYLDELISQEYQSISQGVPINKKWIIDELFTSTLYLCSYVLHPNHPNSSSPVSHYYFNIQHDSGAIGLPCFTSKDTVDFYLSKFVLSSPIEKEYPSVRAVWSMLGEKLFTQLKGQTNPPCIVVNPYCAYAVSFELIEVMDRLNQQTI